MMPLRPSQTNRHQRSERDSASHTETQTVTEMEDLNWFAMALTGDPEFATSLVVDTAKLTSTARGIFRDWLGNLIAGCVGIC